MTPSLRSGIGPEVRARHTLTTAAQRGGGKATYQPRPREAAGGVAHPEVLPGTAPPRLKYRYDVDTDSAGAEDRCMADARGNERANRVRSGLFTKRAPASIWSHANLALVLITQASARAIACCFTLLGQEPARIRCMRHGCAGTCLCNSAVCRGVVCVLLHRGLPGSSPGELPAHC